MKKLLIILIILPIMASAGMITDDTLCWSAIDSISTADLTSIGWDAVYDYTDNIVVTSGSGIWLNDCNPKHDTAKEYVKEIKFVCDTAWGKEWKKIGKSVSGKDVFESVTVMDSVTCHDDTVWANKVLFLLTPDELEKLKKLLD